MVQAVCRIMLWVLCSGLSGILVLGCGGPPEVPPEEEDAASEIDVAALRSLPYASWVPVSLDEEGKAKSGVVRHDPERASPGLNFFAPRHLSEALLVDMEGEVVHRWAVQGGKPGWQHVELLPGGDILVILKDRLLARVDWDSQVKAIYRLRFHHDVDVADDGRIYVASRRERLVHLDDEPMLILDDRITILSPTGEIERHLSLFDHFGEQITSRRRSRILERQEKEGTLASWQERGERDFVETREAPVKQALCPPGSWPDVFHLNSIEILDRDVPGLGPAGHLLISIRELNRIAVINPEDGEITWSWGRGKLEAQHHPTVLDNGHVLVFDNGSRRGYSRILEIDPVSGNIVWKYLSKGVDPFFSKSRGAGQRLPGGNTLITESDFGRVFEVTPEGEIVWEFFNPFLHKEKGEMKRAAIYRTMRVTALEEWGIEDRLQGTL